jgi:hypothetical protein
MSGDTKDDMNLPTRGGGGMPATRGGVGPTRSERRRDERGKEAEERQEAARKQQQNRWLREKPTRQEVADATDKVWALSVQNHEQASALGTAFEALRMTLREMFPGEDFDLHFMRNVGKVTAWREKLQVLESQEMSLPEVIAQVVTWNGDPENLPIRGSSFAPGRLQAKIIRDLDVPRQEKVAFMLALDYPEPMIDQVVAEIEKRVTPPAPPPTHPGVLANPHEADARPSKGGWAPGTYQCRCTKCQNVFLGDKRTTTCASCAYDQVVATRSPGGDLCVCGHERQEHAFGIGCPKNFKGEFRLADDSEKSILATADEVEASTPPVAGYQGVCVKCKRMFLSEEPRITCPTCAEKPDDPCGCEDCNGN